MTTFTDYQARRVEAAIDAANFRAVQCPYDLRNHTPKVFYEEIVGAALQAANSIPLPQESELLEVMAAAMWRKDYPRGGLRVKSWDSNSHEDKELYRNDARSALNALRPALAAMAQNHIGGDNKMVLDKLEELESRLSKCEEVAHKPIVFVEDENGFLKVESPAPAAEGE